MDIGRALEGARDRLDVERAQPAEPGRREIAGDAVHAQAIGAVRRHLDVEHRIVEPHDLGEALADRRVRRQVDDALVVVRDAHLVGRAQHAVRGNAANDALFQHEAGARNGRARRARRCRACRCAHWARRTRPGSARSRCRRCRPAASRRWDAARPRRHARRGTARRSPARSATLSTSRPSMTRRRTISSSGASVSRWVLSQPRVVFIATALPPSRARRAARSRNAGASADPTHRRCADRECRISAWRCARSPCRRRSPGTPRDRCRN